MIEKRSLHRTEIGIGLRNGEHIDGIIVRINQRIVATEEWRRDSITKKQLVNILRELAQKVEDAT